MNLIEVQGLRKRYGDREVVRGIDLSLGEGEIVGILGPNGSGKTTTVECIGGLRQRDGGSVTVAGMDPADGSRELRRILGMQLQQFSLPPKMTVREALALFAACYPDPRPAGELLDQFQLTEAADRRFGTLSGGQQQRLSVALALLGRPRIAFLDELTTGLDPEARRRIWSHLAALRADGVTMLLVTHSTEEAQALCDRIVVIKDGRIVAEGSPEQLGGNQQETSFAADGINAAWLVNLPGVHDVSVDDGRITVRGDEGSPQAVLAALTERSVSVVDLRVRSRSLDEAYLAITNDEG